MNIVTPIPTNVVYTTVNPNTESARRDNVQRETVPQTSALEQSAAETGLGGESDRVKTPGQQPAPVTYERPQNQQGQQAQAGQGELADNGEDPSAGRENAESRQQEQQQQADEAKIQELKARDQEVRAHEQAHASVGGQYAGSPQYEFESGPDSRQYAVGGEVSIDISEESTPERTLQKMQQVQRAALAPAEPSPADLRVAQEAAKKANEARADIAEQSARQAQQRIANVEGTQAGENAQQAPQLDDIVVGSADVGGATQRSLSEDPVAEAIGLESPAQTHQQSDAIVQRVAVIQNFYQGATEPRALGFQQTA